MPEKPYCLHPGDPVAIVAPASAPPDPAAIDKAVAALQKLGFKPRLSRHVRKRWGFLAGSDRERAADLMEMFLDERIRAIICMRGGYGTARILPLLDYAAIHAARKIFVGYSDITSLHCAFLEKAKLVSFHGPMLNSDFIKPEVPQDTVQSFLRTLTHPEAPGSILTGFRRNSLRILSPGVASGRLIGGNLSILCATLGTPYQPSFRRSILFFEDVEEVPYRFDRMLTQLLNAGLLQQVAGIAIGTNARCRDPKARKLKEYRPCIEEVFTERLLPLNVPIVAGFPFGHVRHNATLPVGVGVTLDAEKGDLLVNEPCLRRRS